DAAERRPRWLLRTTANAMSGINPVSRAQVGARGCGRAFGADRPPTGKRIAGAQKRPMLSTLAFPLGLDRSLRPFGLGVHIHLKDFLVLKVAVNDDHKIRGIEDNEVNGDIQWMFPVHVDPEVDKPFLWGDVANRNRRIADIPFKERGETLNIVGAALAGRN